MRDERGFDSHTKYQLNNKQNQMHYWPNHSITKSSTSLGQFKANRPKGYSDEAWAAAVAEFLLNKQIVLNKVPKLSKKDLAKPSK